MTTSTLAALPRLLATVALVLGVACPASWARERDSAPLEVADLFFELNNTDGDLGIHADIDGDEWKRLTIKAPGRRRIILEIQAKRSLRQQGLTQLGFESAEPAFEDLAPAEFFERFPEGPYEIKAVTLEGDLLVGTPTISHVMPASPALVHPPLADCDTPVVVTAPVEISWNPVTTFHPDLGTPGPVVVERYELAIERADLGLESFMVLPPGVTSFPVPALFTDVPGVVKFEVLVKAEGGNRTAEESCFEIQ